MTKLKNKKICIVTRSLSEGGAERFSAILSNILSHSGFEVYMVSILNKIDYDYSGQLLNLGSYKNSNNSIFNQWKRYRTFRDYIKTNKIDLIIDVRPRIRHIREFIITKFLYKVPTIYVIQNHETSVSFSKYKWANKYLYKNEIMVSVSEAIKEKVEKEYNLNNVTNIYNGFNSCTIEKKALEVLNTKLPNDYILNYGRLEDYHKNLKLLIDAYSLSNLSSKGIKLLILGDGPDKKMLMNYATSKTCKSSIQFIEFTSNPYPFVRLSKFTILTSRFEGFPLVIPETLSLGIPVISVDCNSGPREIIQNKYNGLLVENHNANVLAEAMNTFIVDQKLYNYCKSNAKKSVEAFSMENISKQWNELISTVT